MLPKLLSSEENPKLDMNIQRTMQQNQLMSTRLYGSGIAAANEELLDETLNRLLSFYRLKHFEF